MKNHSESLIFPVSILTDTLFVSEGNSVIIPGITEANYTVQERLDAGVTPCEFLDDGVPLSDSCGKRYAWSFILYIKEDACTGLAATREDQSAGAVRSFSDLDLKLLSHSIISGVGERFF